MVQRSSKVFFQIYRLKKTAEIFLVPPLWEKKRKMFDFFFFFPPTAAGGAICVFLVANCQHGHRNQLVRRSILDFGIDSAHGQPTRYLASPTNRDDGLEDIKRIHGLGGVLWYHPKPEKSLFFAIRDGWRGFVFCFVQTSGQMFFLSDAWSAPAT